MFNWFDTSKNYNSSEIIVEQEYPESSYNYQEETRFMCYPLNLQLRGIGKPEVQETKFESA